MMLLTMILLLLNRKFNVSDICELFRWQNGWYSFSTHNLDQIFNHRPGLQGDHAGASQLPSRGSLKHHTAARKPVWWGTIFPSLTMCCSQSGEKREEMIWEAGLGGVWAEPRCCNKCRTKMSLSVRDQQDQAGQGAVLVLGRCFWWVNLVLTFFYWGFIHIQVFFFFNWHDWLVKNFISTNNCFWIVK